MTDEMGTSRDSMKSLFGLLRDVRSDQELGKPAPALQKTPEPGREIIDLPEPNSSVVRQADIHSCITNRRSNRAFTQDTLSRKELSYLLWATQGVQKIVANGKATLRTVPSAGARHPFETYLLINRIEGIEPGIHRYLPLSHQLIQTARPAHLSQKVTSACHGQEFVGDGAVVFVWSCIPYRAEWRYHVRSHKTMLLDAGHVCQNLYLACEALNLGTCAIAAYDQQEMDRLLDLDGQDEFVVYLAPVGRPV
jgi:SagB-type dehydrogenase family enzyme